MDDTAREGRSSNCPGDQGHRVDIRIAAVAKCCAASVGHVELIGNLVALMPTEIARREPT